ncbi:hypothetical protein QTQ03_08525 [Micromonospora sp. WMMA1363]|uniref:hypothetical protein n=1 Tax=Micromonospora sp. WMMA1363 TaxID=3053985 RepID=UPI00259D1C7A|nr:hypothetical protein [Micromonospora sp. WMMA1363]MDM4719627.1 hypothetical protein [Micromonospora sp. WMMA1363]
MGKRRVRTAYLAVTFVAAVALGVVAVVFGRGGLEVASWLAGVGSLLGAVAALAQGAARGRTARLGHTVRAWLGGKIRDVEIAGRKAGDEITASSWGRVEGVRITDQIPVQPGPADDIRPAARTVPVADRAPPAVGGGPAVPAADVGATARSEVRVRDGLISRDEQLRRVLTGIRTDVSGIFVVLGGHGMGKSAFLRQLRADLRRELPDVDILPACSEVSFVGRGLDETYSGQYGAAATAASLHQVLNKSTALLGDLVKEVIQRFAGFTAAVEKSMTVAQTMPPQRVVVEAGGFRSRISNVNVNQARPTDGQSPEERLRNAQQRIDRAFLDDWTVWRAGRPTVLLLDGFETLIDDAVGQWFVALAAQLPNTAVVLPMIPREYHEHGRGALDPERTETLPRFTLSEVDAYLLYHFGDDLSPELARVVWGFTGGHPSGLNLVIHLIHGRRAEASRPGGLRAMLAQLSTEGDLDPARLVRKVIKPDRHPGVWRTVETAALLNTFDVPMLRHLMEDAEPAMDGAAVSAAVERINRLGLLDPLPVAGRFRLHDFIRPRLSDDVRQFQPDRWASVHRRAATYYYDLISSLEDAADRPYGSWLKYENPVWQMYETDWLFHSAQLSDERPLTRAQFVVLFMEAFWWWGLYVDFPFCHQLLESWGRAIRDERDRSLLEQLIRFQDNYPPGADKPPGGHWTEVRQALRTIGDLCGLRQGWRNPALSDKAQQVRRTAWLYLRLFTAHAHWYNGQLDRAEAEYRSLEPELVDLDDQVFLSYFYFEWADIARAAGDRVSAAAHIRQACAQMRTLVADGEEDPELQANLHRCLGDLLLANDPVTAAQEYGRAVLHAFLLQQATNTLNDSVNPPDEYTQRFYQEMSQFAAGKAAAWAGHPERHTIMTALVGPIGADVPDASLVEQWRAELSIPSGLEPGSRTAALAQLAGKLFPRGPAISDLHRRTSEFTDHWANVTEDVDRDALTDLDRIDQLAVRIDRINRTDGPADGTAVNPVG